MRCQYVRDDGSRCQSPENFVDPETGLCHAHGPEGSETMAEWGRKGAEAKKKKKRLKSGLDADELPALASPQAAEEWLDTIGRAVATGRLSHREGKALARLVREFLRAHDAGKVSERMEALEEKIARLKAGDLEVVK